MIKRITALFLAVMFVFLELPKKQVEAAGSVETIKGWSVVLNNGCLGSAEIDYNTGVDNSPSLKLVCDSDVAPNVYMLMATYVPVESGKTYRYGGVVKSDNSANVVTMVDWGTRSSLLFYGRTFDFSKYEFKYKAEKTGSAQVMFLIEGKTDGVWFDNMFFIDESTGENLFTNPDFNEEEEEEEKKKEPVAENEYQQRFYDINKNSEYDVHSADEVSSLFYNIPVYYKDITVDGDSSDWGNITMAHMPIDEVSQFQVYLHSDESVKDTTVDYAFAYDEEYFYMYYNVYDDLFESFDTLNEYWMGDSIQFMLSERGEITGLEIGIIYDDKTDSGRLFSYDISQEKLNDCIVTAKQQGNYTIYEAAIPWSIKYRERPDEILFDFIVNDNDFKGRKYCVQLAPGIAEGKDNTFYPTLKMVEKDQDWYAWVDGTITPEVDEETIFNLYISNYGEDKTFKIKINGEEKNVTVKKGKGVREPIAVTFSEEKAGKITAEVEYEGRVYEIVHNVTAKRSKPSVRTAKTYQREVKAYVKEIAGLIEQCETLGISVEYEKVNLQTLEYFAGYMMDDINHDDLTRMSYTYLQLKDIYAEAKENLEAYISGEKTPLRVPKYTGEGFKIDSTLTYADSFDGEKYEENRPTFFVGYGHQTTVMNEVFNLTNLGVNSVQRELGLRGVFDFNEDVLGGTFGTNKADADFTIQKEEKHSGERAARIRNRTPSANDTYARYQTSIAVKPNTKYIGSMWVKGSNVRSMCIATNNFAERTYFSATDEWQEVSFSFTTKDGEYLRTIQILTDDICDVIYLDDLSIKAEGGDTELISYGGFEEYRKEGEDYTLVQNGLKHIESMLIRAEEANVTVDVLLSPHYMVSWLYENYPEARNTYGGSFMPFNVNHPAARELVEKYIRFIIPILKEYKALGSICLANEPAFNSARLPDFYNALWWEFLKETHGTIENLNEKYASEYKNFEEVQMPTEIGANPICFDYKEFNDIQFSGWHIWMADIIHEIAPEIPVHTKFVPMTCSFEESLVRTNVTSGFGLEYLTSDKLEINGCDSHNFIDNSAGNKVNYMWYDFQVSIKDAPIFDTEHHVMADRSDRVYSDEYDAYAVANVWQGAIHYRANSVLWTWERTYDKSTSHWALMTQRPKAVWGIGKTTYDLNRLAYEIEALQKEKTDIALLYSDATRLYDMNQINMQYETYNALMCSGKKVKFVVEKQAEKMHDFDVLFVPAIDYATENTLDNVIRFINNGGKVVLIGENCFKYNEYMRDANKEKREFIISNSTVYPNIKSDGSRLDGMTQNEYTKLIKDYLVSQNKIWIEVVDAYTGEICDDIEYTTAVYDGKLIVNIYNLGETVDVNVFVSGKKVKECTELRSMTLQDDTITAEKYMPILLEIDAENSFIDTYGHWAEDMIYEACFKNLVRGTSESRFDPDSKITRAEFTTMLIRAAEMLPESYCGVFQDVDEEKWYARYAQAAFSGGLIDGEYFRPEEYITREEMCDMAVRAFENKHNSKIKMLTFSDTDEIDDIISVSKALGSGIVNGYDDNTFRPKDGLTRAEAVSVILKLYKKG